VPEYRPPQRILPARILTPSGWMRGTFHVPRMQSLLDFVSQQAPFFSLTGVELASSQIVMPFVALRRSAANLIVPACDERSLLLAREQPNAVVLTVTCVLEAGTVSGRLAVPPHLRVSDYLAHSAGFLVMRDADLGLAGVLAPIVLVNAGALVALSDSAPAAAAEAAPERPGDGDARRGLAHA
jgi:hypothetical protein